MPEKSNIWRDCVDGYYDWVKEHIEEVGGHKRRRAGSLCGARREAAAVLCTQIDALNPGSDWLAWLVACRVHR